MRNRIAPYLFVTPAMILLSAFGLLPLLVAAAISLTDMDISGLANWANVDFVGLRNYMRLLSDRDFWQALANTALFVAIGVPSVVGLSLVVALMLNYSDNVFARAMRAFYFVPAITGIVAISLVWGYLYNTQFGLLNWLLSTVGIGQVQWLSDPVLAKFSVALVAIWRGTGLNIIIFLAALKGVPKQFLDAADVDGIGPVRKIVHIVLPIISYAILFVTLTTTVAWLQYFDEAFVLTDGGPLGTTTSMSIFLYKEGFRQNQFAYASAGSVVLFVIIGLVTLLQLKLQGRTVEY